MIARALTPVALLESAGSPANAARVFYRTQDWLGTSPPTQLVLARAAIRAAIQAIVATRPDGVWAHFSNLAGQALDCLCGRP